MSSPRTAPIWILASVAMWMGMMNLAWAQTAQKPSFYRARQQAPQDSKLRQKPADAAPFLARIDSRAAFDRLARVYDAGSAFELPHLIFVIDRRKQDQVYYVNTRRYDLHEQFVASQRLVSATSRAALAANYKQADRRFHPFDATHRDTTLITAKRGLGGKVVEGRLVAEQVFYNRRDKAVQVLTRSAEAQALQLDEQGGVKEVPIDPQSRAVLSDELVARLAQAGERVKRTLGGTEQDIEWAVDGQGDIVILQSRPFVDRRNP